MAWGRKHTAAQTPAWSQDDYHTAFASKIKEQIEQGVAPWQKPWRPFCGRVRSPSRQRRPHRRCEARRGRELRQQPRRRAPGGTSAAASGYARPHFKRIVV